MRIDNGFCDGDVIGRGDLDVLTIALDESNLVAVAFYHRGIISEAVVIRLTVRSF